jgi:NAD(P)H-hydrate epimerase
MIPPMNQLPYTLYRAADVRELDRIAIEEYGIPGITLMSRAGAALFDELCCRWPEARRIVVVCGGGNNGGDGYVVARLAKEQGFDVTLMALRDPSMLTGDAKTAWGAARAAGLAVVTFNPEVFSNADVVVDAIFGTGLDREVNGEWATAINAINASNVPVLAVDIPSGLHADSGRMLGAAIVADATVTFIGLKCGLLTGEGRDCCGAIRFDDLGVPQQIYEQRPSSLQRIDWLRLKALLPTRRRSAHKGDHGHVLIVGGNHGMAGAVRLAAEASLRVGSGLTTVATRPEHTAAMAAARPEVMWRGIDDVTDLQPLLQRATVVAIGPGLGQDRWGQQLLNCVIESRLPLVVDADALNLLAIESFKNSRWILTPHPGEAARLLQCATTDVNRDRFHTAEQLSQQYGGVVVLKGAGTLVAEANGHIAVCSDGNPGMATAGMGDVLTGVIAGLLAQGLNLSQAAQCGVALHAAAADKAATAGERGMMAGDVVECLRRFVN